MIWEVERERARADGFHPGNDPRAPTARWWKVDLLVSPRWSLTPGREVSVASQGHARQLILLGEFVKNTGSNKNPQHDCKDAFRPGSEVMDEEVVYAYTVKIYEREPAALDPPDDTMHGIEHFKSAFLPDEETALEGVPLCMARYSDLGAFAEVTPRKCGQDIVRQWQNSVATIWIERFSVS